MPAGALQCGEPAGVPEGVGIRRRLTNDEFIALRSLSRDPWIGHQGFHFTWKHRRRWWRINDGMAVNHDTDKVDWLAHLPHLEVQAKAAFEKLEAMGLAQITEQLCCPGTECHRNDRSLYTLTDAGWRLLTVLDRPSSAPVAPKVPEPKSWKQKLYEFFVGQPPTP